MGMVKGKWEFTVSHFFIDFSGFAGIWANGLREVIEVLTLLLVIFAVLSYIDNHNNKKK